MSGHVVLVPLGLGAVGGFTVDVRQLANGLTERGHTVTVVGVASAGTGFPGLDRRVELLRLEPARPRRLAARLSVGFGIRRVLRERPDALVQVFSCLPSYITFASLLAARRTGHPLVWYPSMHPARRAMWSGGGLQRGMRVFDRIAPRAARHVDAVAVNTEVEADYFRTLGARHVEVLPPAVADDPVLPAAAADAFRARLGIGAAPLVVIVALRAERRKGLDYALASFREVRRELPSARLVVVGIDGAPAEGVEYAGRVSDDDLVAALRTADVVFVPSLYEAFSRIVIEAWQQATPVVVTSGVALAPTVAEAGGPVVPYGDVHTASTELARLLADPAAARQLGVVGRGLVEERFVLPVVLDRYEDLYRRLRRRRAPR